MTEIGEGVFIPLQWSLEEEYGESKKAVTIRYSLFFDGTLNSRANTLTRKRLEKSQGYSEKEREKALGKLDDSYFNDDTNVAKMERYVVDDKIRDYTFSLYIEGPGTGEKADAFLGYAFGTGDTGVPKKVEKALMRLLQMVIAAVEPGAKIIEFVVDVFGFSRGAAAARFFIHEAVNSGKIVRGLNSVFEIDDNVVTVQCVGLYDTVASYGANHSNDTADLKLDSVSNGKVDSVFHLVADNEYRDNFPLTDIYSAGGKGKEIKLPGAHSDIGGGYSDGGESLEINKSVSNELIQSDMNDLIAKGWFREDEIKVVETAYPYTDFYMPYYRLYTNRVNIINKYSRIPLHIMAIYARKRGINIVPSLEIEHFIPQALSSAYKTLVAFAQGGSSNWDRTWLPQARHDYFHFSARYGGPTHPNRPRFVDNKRMREVFGG